MAAETSPKYESNPSRRKAKAALCDTWGHTGFREGQWQIIEAVIQGRDVLGVLPTGTGKSICYQLPAVMNSGLTLVISPIIALMRDQVESLARKAVSATSIDSSTGTRESDQRLTDARFGKYRLLYVSPERLRSEVFLERCRALPIRSVAVDEAHCISEWGHSFRPAYLEIADALESIGRPPVVALTATATPAVRRDIVSALRLKSPIQVTGGFDRPNIVWSVFRNENKRRRVESVVTSVPGSGILYASTRRDAEQWADWLIGAGVSAEPYHAGVPRHVRDARQNRWMSGEIRVITATSAFGMGIDKADVRFVVHVNIPGSVEAYYQEAGRAGRDGRKAYAVLLHNDGDEDVQKALLRSSFPETDTIRAVYDGVCSIAGIPVGAKANGPSVVTDDAITRATSRDASEVRGALGYLERQGIVTMLDDRQVSGYLRISNLTVIRELAVLESHKTVARVATWLIRNERLVDSDNWWTSLSFEMVAEQTGVDVPAVASAFEYLSETGSIDWRKLTEGTVFVLSEPRQEQLRMDKGRLRRTRRAAEKRLHEVISYATTRSCRREYLLAYFGESPSANCGRCDVCLKRDTNEPSAAERDQVAREVVGLIRAGQPRSEWVLSARVDEGALDHCLDWLIREGYVRTSPDLDGTFELTRLGSKLD